MGREHISYSEASLFNRCQFAHHLKYRKGLRVIQSKEHLRLGSLVDKGLESALRRHHMKEDPDTIRFSAANVIACEVGKYLRLDSVLPWTNESTEPDEPTIRQQAFALGDKAFSIATRAIKYLNLGSPGWTTLEIDGEPAIQTKLEATINGKKILGYLDWVATDKHGNTYLIDFKVRKQRTSEDAACDNLEDDWQLPLYAALLREKGIDVPNVAHLDIYGQVPKEPKINKNGSVSKSACDTDWPTYCEAIYKSGGILMDYQAMREKLEAKSWLRWTTRLVPTLERDDARDRVYNTSISINRDTEPHKNIFPLTCAMCDYREMCRMDRRGADYMSMVGVTHYVKGEEQATGENVEKTPAIEGGDA